MFGEIIFDRRMRRFLWIKKIENITYCWFLVWIFVKTNIQTLDKMNEHENVTSNDDDEFIELGKQALNDEQLELEQKARAQEAINNLIKSVNKMFEMTQLNIRIGTVKGKANSEDDVVDFWTDTGAKYNSLQKAGKKLGERMKDLKDQLDLLGIKFIFENLGSKQDDKNRLNNPKLQTEKHQTTETKRRDTNQAPEIKHRDSNQNRRLINFQRVKGLDDLETANCVCVISTFQNNKINYADVGRSLGNLADLVDKAWTFINQQGYHTFLFSLRNNKDVDTFAKEMEQREFNIGGHKYKHQVFKVE